MPAAPGTTIRVRGVKIVKGEFNGRIKRAVNTLVKMAKAGAEPVREEAERLVPRRTKTGQQRIVAPVKERSRFRARAHVGPVKKRWYLRFHEFGTSKMGARPFLRPAKDAKATESQKAMGQAFRDEVVR